MIAKAEHPSGIWGQVSTWGSQSWQGGRFAEVGEDGAD
jgi:hypothetical protein